MRFPIREADDARRRSYFYLWLTEYSKLYNAHPPAQRPHQDILILSKSFNTAVDTFFSEASPLELNVPSDVRREIDERIRSVSAQAEPFLPPSAFDRVNHEASESLAISFKAFRKQVVRNADRNRGWFAMFLGITTWALGLIPTIVCAVLNKNRGWRALGIPLWWFGPVVALGGWGKVRSPPFPSPATRGQES